MVDRSVGLDRVRDRVAVRGLDVTIDGADDAGRDALRVAERAPDRDDALTGGDGGAVGELERGELADGTETLITAVSVDGSVPTSVALAVDPSLNRTVILVAPSTTWSAVMMLPDLS